MTVDQIVSAIRALPVRERLRIIELVAHDAASEGPGAEAESGSSGAVKLIERHGLLFIESDAAVPTEAFDHRPDREARADRIWGGS